MRWQTKLSKKQKRLLKILKIYTDGGARPNPGLGGIGVVIYRDDILILEAHQFMGEKKTNNQMEFIAVINGIAFAIQMFNCKKAELYTDCEIVYGSMLPTSHPKHKIMRNRKLIALHGALVDILKQINVTIHHVGRDVKYIKQAHNLATRAIIYKKSSIIKKQP